MNLETLQRGLDILFLFKDYSMMSVPEISLNLPLPQSSVYRYITSLKERGMVDKRGNEGNYGLGRRILQLAQGLRDNPSLRDIALPVMQSLQQETGETILLNVMKGYRVFCIGRVESDQALRFSPPQFTSRFMHVGAAAKVILAQLSEREQNKIIKEGLPKATNKSIANAKELKKNLREIRKNGYSVSAGEFVLGARGIAAPILVSNRKVVASIEVIGPVQRLTASKVPKFAKMVVERANEIANRAERLSNHMNIEETLFQDSKQQTLEV